MSQDYKRFEMGSALDVLSSFKPKVGDGWRGWYPVGESPGDVVPSGDADNPVMWGEVSVDECERDEIPSYDGTARLLVLTLFVFFESESHRKALDTGATGLGALYNKGFDFVDHTVVATLKKEIVKDHFHEISIMVDFWGDESDFPF